MSVIINPGSGPIAEGEGWTNSYETAHATALQWLERMHDDGLRDVELFICEKAASEGRWRFGFRHAVTAVVVWLETHGIDDLAAYEKARVFTPRVYWAESSLGEPRLADWAHKDFVAVKTFERKAS